MTRRPTREQVRRVEAILQRFDVKALEAFLAEPGARDTLAACDAVARTIRHRTSPEDEPPARDRLVFLQRLLVAAPDINRPSDDPSAHFATAFGTVVEGTGWMPEDAQRKLVEQLLPRADPNVPSGHYRNGQGISALDIAARLFAHRPKLLRLLAGKATRDGWLNALTLVLEGADKSPGAWEHVLGFLTGDAGGTDRTGLSPLHVASVFCEPEVVRAILVATPAPTIGTTGRGVVLVSEAWPPAGGVVPGVPYEPGLTAIELLDRVLDFAIATFAQHERKLSLERRKESQAAIDRRRAGRELLVGAGLVGRPVAPRIVPAWKRDIDKLFLDLADLADVDTPSLAADLDRVHLGDSGPWGYFAAAVEALEDFFANDAVLAWLAEGSLFRRLVTGDTFSGSDQRMLATELDPDDEHPIFRQLPIEEYPKEARAGLRQGNFIAADSDTDEVVFLWAGRVRPDGSRSSKVCRADLDTFEVLAPSVEAFLRAELDRALATM